MFINFVWADGYGEKGGDGRNGGNRERRREEKINN
jgi:hypothetical protein